MAFAITVLLAGHVFGRTPASIGAVLVAYAIVAGAVMSAVCQVIFALFQSGHRKHAVRDLLLHSPILLFVTGALAALGEAHTDTRVITARRRNSSACPVAMIVPTTDATTTASIGRYQA